MWRKTKPKGPRVGNLSRIIRCFVDGESPESARQVYVRKNSTEDDFRQYIEMLFDGKEPVGMRIPNGSDIPLHPSVVYEKTKANDVCMLIYDHVEFGKERSARRAGRFMLGVLKRKKEPQPKGVQIGAPQNFQQKSSVHALAEEPKYDSVDEQKADAAREGEVKKFVVRTMRSRALRRRQGGSVYSQYNHQFDEIPEEWQTIFLQAGIYPADMEDPKVRRSILITMTSALSSEMTERMKEGEIDVSDLEAFQTLSRMPSHSTSLSRIRRRSREDAREGALTDQQRPRARLRQATKVADFEDTVELPATEEATPQELKMNAVKKAVGSGSKSTPARLQQHINRLDSSEGAAVHQLLTFVSSFHLSRMDSSRISRALSEESRWDQFYDRYGAKPKKPSPLQQSVESAASGDQDASGREAGGKRTVAEDAAGEVREEHEEDEEDEEDEEEEIEEEDEAAPHPVVKELKELCEWFELAMNRGIPSHVVSLRAALKKKWVGVRHSRAQLLPPEEVEEAQQDGKCPRWIEEAEELHARIVQLLRRCDDEFNEHIPLEDASEEDDYAYSEDDLDEYVFEEDDF